jgi:hypothetical protein
VNVQYYCVVVVRRLRMDVNVVQAANVSSEPFFFKDEHLPLFVLPLSGKWRQTTHCQHRSHRSWSTSRATTKEIKGKLRSSGFYSLTFSTAAAGFAIVSMSHPVPIPR